MKQLNKSQTRILVLGLVLVVALSVGVVALSKPSALTLRDNSTTRTAVIQILKNEKTVPATLVVSPGTRITWQNLSGKTIDLALHYGSQFTPKLEPSGSYSLTVYQPGSYDFTVGGSKSSGSLIIK